MSRRKYDVGEEEGFIRAKSNIVHIGSRVKTSRPSTWRVAGTDHAAG